MTPGQIIKAIIKKRGLNQTKVSELANCEPMYVSKICNDTLKKGKAYESVLNVLSIPHEILIFKSFCCDNISNEHRRTLAKEIMPEILFKIDSLFDCKID